ncbi:MAG: hypothetical protein ACK53L_01535, partial [Pirellulaceae bacterium]
PQGGQCRGLLSATRSAGRTRSIRGRLNGEQALAPLAGCLPQACSRRQCGGRGLGSRDSRGKRAG